MKQKEKEEWFDYPRQEQVSKTKKQIPTQESSIRGTETHRWN